MVKIPPGPKAKARALLRRTRRLAVRLFASYDSPELIEALRRLGIRPGDSVMVHSAFEPHHGFRGSSADVIDALLAAVGPEGTLLMPSLPYSTSSQQWLDKGKLFDVRKTPSAMGLVSEMFRRRPGVGRSVHPTHPVLAFGAKAEWFLSDHEKAIHPCGPGTPFGKLLDARGKVAFLNVPFFVFTFFHYLEHHLLPHLPYRLYAEPAYEVPVVNWQGETQTVRTHVFTRDAIRRRRAEVLEQRLRSSGVLRSVRVGASRLLALDLQDVMQCVDDMVREGVFFLDMSPAGDEQGVGR